MLEVRNLAFSFGKNTPLLRDISLAVKPGTFTAVLGQNGCGKSTLLSLMTAAHKPDAGEVLLDGTPIAQVDRKERARKIAYVSQHSHANRLTVFDSVLLGRRPFMEAAPSAQDRAIVSEVLGELGLADYALRYLDELSGGEYQIVVLARAFVQRTETLLLDEPTNNLDPSNQQEVMRLVCKEVEQRGIGALAVMHDINLALKYCDCFLFIKEGVVDAYGTSEIVTSEEIERVYGMKSEVIEHNDHRIVVPL